MTNQEKIIVSAYTGTLMCDFSDVHEYIEKKLGRPVFTHEMANSLVLEEIRQKTRSDFLAICQDNTDDLISRSALLKEIGDPDDGMTWPSKHGIVAMVKNAPAVK